MADPAPNNACRNPQDNRGGGGVMPNASSQNSGLLGWLEGEYSRAACATETAYNQVAGAVTREYNSAAQSIENHYTLAANELRSYVDSVPDHIAHATNWPELKYWAELALGSQTFNVGVGVGLAEGLVGAVVDIGKLAWSLGKLQMKIWQLQKTFILAALYEQAHANHVAAIAANPLTYPVAKAANWLMGKQLEEADKNVKAMLEQLERLLTHPSPDFKKLFSDLQAAMGRGKDSLIGGWQHYKTLLYDHKPSARFQAGVMTGKVLFEVIMLILMIISIYGAAAEAGTAIARAAGRFMARFAEEFPALYEFIVGAREVAEAERLAPAVERAAEVERAAAAEPEPVRPKAQQPDKADASSASEDAQEKVRTKQSVASQLEDSEFNGIKADRVRPGTNDKVAVIGRSMNGAVNPYAEGLQGEGYAVETFKPSASANAEWADLIDQYAPNRVPDDVIPSTQVFQENQAWAQKLADQGYTVVDVDNPTGQGPSPFYNMETQTLFGTGTGAH